MSAFVIDTNVMVSALKSRNGASYQVLKMFFEDRISVALSLPLYREYWEVTERSKLEIDPDIREGVLKAMAKLSIPTEIHFKWRPFLKDESDNMVLELAVASNSDIITHNVKDFKGVEDKFNIRVIRPREVFNERS
jgi:putative PIN family toxin of toxin-antitoxin system